MPELEGPENRFSRLRLWVPSFFLMGSLVYASAFAPAAPSGPSIVGFDKVAHFFVFGLMGTLLMRSMPYSLKDRRRWMLAWAGVLCFGMADEVMQYFHPLRSFDPYDWLADASGSLLAIWLYRNWDWYRRLLEFPLWGGLPKNRASAQMKQIPHEQSD